MGGPLSDGTLIGERVMCPWHGSEFNVCSGAVECGPASSPIRTHEVRVQMDRVQVKAPAVVERPLTEAGSLG
jgi:nitrite reductase/ring-hydroxylating ferredoxin subunit